MFLTTRRWPGGFARRSSIATCVTALVLGTSLTTATAAQASPVATVKATTQRMTEPTLNYSQVGTYNAGTQVTLACYLRGQSVKGYYSPWLPNGGWDNLWYRASDGYWIADVDISTGSDDPVTGACSESTPGATVKTTTQRMTAATLNATQSGNYNVGTGLSLRCYVRGQSVKGYYSPWLPNGGWDNLWYMVTDGYWVADVDINTGSNNPVTRQCGSQNWTVSTGHYNRLAAAFWEYNHVGDAEEYQNSDCTNFLSHALWYGGGMPQSTEWQDFPRGSTEYNANALFRYFQRHPELATVTKLDWNSNILPGATLGDVIAYSWNPSSKKSNPQIIDHLAMITTFNGSGYPYVTQHTPAQVNRFWSWSTKGFPETGNHAGWIANESPGAGAYLIHINY